MAGTVRGHSGFTLTEVLIALFLVSIIGVAVTNLDLFATRLTRRGERTLWLQQEPRRILDWMRLDVTRAVTIDVVNNVAFGDGWGIPLGVGVTGNGVELTLDNNGTPADPTDDDIVRYAWTTNDQTPPPPFNGTPSPNDLVRRNRFVGGVCDQNDIIGGIMESDPPSPDRTIVRITAFDVTLTPDTDTASVTPANLLQITITAQKDSSIISETYYLQSRQMRAQGGP